MNEPGSEARPPTEVIVDDIDAPRDTLGVGPICKVSTKAGTQIAPGTYYATKTRGPSARSVSDAGGTGPAVGRTSTP